MPDQLVKSVSVRLSTTGYDDARLKIDKLTVAAEKLKAENPTISVKVDAARAQLEARLAGMGIRQELTRGVMGSAIGGAAAGGGGLLSGLGPLLGAGGTPLAIAGIGAGLAATLSGSLGIIPLLASATAGVGAFAALAVPAFTAVSGAVTKIAADTAKYQAATTAASKSTALKAIQADWAALDKPQQAAVKSIQGIQASFGKMATAFQPQVMKIFNDFLPAIQNLMPVLGKFANAAAPAIDKLVQQFSKFTASAGFKSFIDNLVRLTPGAITTIGDGLGRVAGAAGKLLIAFENPNAQRMLRILFDTVQWTLAGIAKAFEVVTPVVVGMFARISRNVRQTVHDFDAAWDSVKHATDNMVHAFDNVRHFVAVMATDVGTALDKVATFFLHLGGRILTDVGSLGRLLFPAGASLVSGLIAGLESMIPGLTTVVNFIKALLGQASAASTSIAGLGAAGQAALNPGFGRINPGMIPHRAAGGPAAGLTWVGERGPELLSLPLGSSVYSHGASQQMQQATSNSDVVDAIHEMNDTLAALLTIGNSVTAGVGRDVGSAFGGMARSAAYRALYPGAG